MRIAYRLSLVCAVLPLAAGLVIFTTWLATQWHWLMPAGIYTIYAGLVLVSVGALALARAWWLARQAKQPLGLSAVICAVLLLSNFPVAAGLTFAAFRIETAYTVVITNSSTDELRHVRVSGGGCAESFGSIDPGEEAKRTFWIKSEGELQFLADGPTGAYQENIDGYVTSGFGGKAFVTVNRDGTLTVSHEDA
ncbi:MAG: hypothetical protein ACJAVJ_000849 [Planctomycetota bacterium]|jgi:hypothetical protein